MRLKKSIKRGIAAVTITGIMASSAMTAFAKDYHIDYGDIKVDQDKVSYTDKDGTKYDKGGGGASLKWRFFTNRALKN